jgi:hypothetical protein
MSHPERGEMILHDFMTPSLNAGSYRIDALTRVTIPGEGPKDLTGSGYFDVVGPRFALPPSDVGGVYPPSNSRGAFGEVIPHIALGRRTLPWERPLDPRGKIGIPTRHAGDPPPPQGPAPWMALLLLEEGEYTLLENWALQDIVPAEVFADLGSPAGIRCNGIELGSILLADILPSVEELKVLTHVRQVNVDDRELSAGDSDGWFAVVMSNRLPSPEAECRACLVSLEQRWDLVARDPPPVESENAVLPVFGRRDIVSRDTPAVRSATFDPRSIVAKLPAGGATFLARDRLVLLHSWKYFNQGIGSFRDLMQKLDVGMMGTVRGDWPKVTDTGHIAVTVHDRGGVEQQALYRGPLVPYPLTRDPLGPYHNADQARRVTPETGAEDVSYAAAFETGRLLAAADGRLAQELMRWRRDAYRQAARATTAGLAAKSMNIAGGLEARLSLVPPVAAAVTGRFLDGVGPVADPYGLDVLQQAPGLDPSVLQQVWQLSSLSAAAAILGQPGEEIASPVAPAAEIPRAPVAIDDVAADTPALDHLRNARDRLAAAATTRLSE